MCRIAGIYNPASASLLHDITVMRDCMKHGGPDGEGIYLDSTFPLALGHRRLSLIDLTAAGQQPMADLEGSLQIVFNGEIYNFLELTHELKALGHVFITACDTEVILKAYTQWGVECFSRFNGMFALALFDKRSGQLILARDHAGIKPLYYSIGEGCLYFASEIRAFKKVVPGWAENENWKISFLTFGYLPEPVTTLENVVPLKKGTFVIIELPALTVREKTFARFAFTNTINTLPEAVEEVKNKLTAAVKRHLISDAPIGLFLSGGIDSSLLTLIAHTFLKDNLQTLSIVFEDEKFSEAKYQKLIINATGAHHRSFLVKEEEFANSLPDILEAMDQPSIDGINSYFICKYARKAGLKAALNGIGADELFGGYDFYDRSRKLNILNKLPSKAFGIAESFSAAKNKKLAFLQRNDILGEYLLNRGLYSPEQTASILNCTIPQVHTEINKVDIAGSSSIKNKKDQHSWTDQNLYMQSQLLKDVDYMGMWHGLEVRVPFLDKELMQTVHSIAPAIKYNGQQKKHLLIKAFQQILPQDVYLRKKQGFNFPFEKWIVPVQTKKQRDPAFIEKYKQLQSGKIRWAPYWGYLLTAHKAHIYYFNMPVKKILFLNLSSFFFLGGIEKFNRAFLKALSNLEAEGKITADSWSAYDDQVDPRYFNPAHYRGFKGKRWKFVLAAWKEAGNYDTVILSHINISLTAWGIKKRFQNKEIILVAHGIEVWDKLAGIKLAVLQSADKILAVSNFTKQKLVSVQAIPPGKISIFPNTIDPCFVYPVAFGKPQYLLDRYGICKNDTVIFTLTRLSHSEKYKGYDKVVEVLPCLKKNFPALKYVVAGKADAREKKRLHTLIKENGLSEDVILTGYVEEEEVADHFLLADVFIMPSRKEGFGIVFIEAMACGLPVIAGNQDGSVDALANGELGTLVNPEKGAEILQSLTDILYRQQQSMNLHAKKDLQKKVVQTFGFETYKQRLEKTLA